MADQIQETTETWNWRQHLRRLVPILGIYFALAFYGLDHQSLWEDEYNSVWRVTVSPNPIWKDGHGFVYFALLRLWIKLGASEWVLRSLSVLLGAVAVCLTYAIGLALLDRRAAALVGTVLFATSPFLIWYSQEARYINLVLVSTLITAYAFHRVISDGRFAWWLVYGGATLLTLLSFIPTLLVPVGHGLYLLYSSLDRALRKKWFACQFVVFFLFALWFVNGTHFLKAIADATRTGQHVLLNRDVFPFSGEFNNVRPAVIPYTFFALSTGFSLGPSPRELYANRSLTPLLSYVPSLVILAAIYGVLLLSGWLVLRRRCESRMFLSLWIAVPVLGVFGIAKLLDTFYDVRYVAMVLPAYILFLAAGIVSFRKPTMRLLLFGAVLGVHGVALANYYFDPRYAREDTRAAATFLGSAAGPRDVVLVVGTVSSLPYYYKGIPALTDFGSLDGTGQSLTERLRKLSTNHDRLWLVQIRPWQIDRAGQLKAALDGAYRIVEQRHFSGVDVHAYHISELNPNRP